MSSTCLFENERVRVSNFILPSGDKVLCEHQYNTVRWQVGTALHQKDDEDPLESYDKEVTFIDAGNSFYLANRCSIDSRQILFEINNLLKIQKTKFPTCWPEQFILQTLEQSFYLKISKNNHSFF